VFYFGSDITLNNLKLTRSSNGGSAACASPRSSMQIDLVSSYQEVDKGFNQLLRSKQSNTLTTSLCLAVLFFGLISWQVTLTFRQRRNTFNALILQESNQKLDGLLWILACHLYPEKVKDKLPPKVNLQNVELASKIGQHLFSKQAYLKKKYQAQQMNDVRSIENNKDSDYYSESESMSDEE